MKDGRVDRSATSAPGAGLALSLSIPRRPRHHARQTLIACLPGLALDRRPRRPGLAQAGFDPSAALAWSYRPDSRPWGPEAVASSAQQLPGGRQPASSVAGPAGAPGAPPANQSAARATTSSSDVRVGASLPVNILAPQPVLKARRSTAHGHRRDTETDRSRHPALFGVLAAPESARQYASPRALSMAPVHTSDFRNPPDLPAAPARTASDSMEARGNTRAGTQRLAPLPDTNAPPRSVPGAPDRPRADAREISSLSALHSPVTGSIVQRVARNLEHLLGLPSIGNGTGRRGETASTVVPSAPQPGAPLESAAVRARRSPGPASAADAAPRSGLPRGSLPPPGAEAGPIPRFRGPAASLLDLMPALALASPVEPLRRAAPPDGEAAPIDLPGSGAFERLQTSQWPPIAPAGGNRAVMQGAAMMASVIEAAVQREVQSVVQRQLEKSSAPTGAGPVPVGADRNIVSDAGIRDLLRRMKELTREERFRRGALR